MLGGISIEVSDPILGDFCKTSQLISKSSAGADERMLVVGGSFHSSFLQCLFGDGSALLVVDGSGGVAPTTHLMMV